MVAGDASAAALVARVLEGEPRAVARAITVIEDDLPGAAAIVRGIFGRTGRAEIVGLTGPPGAGKSTLADRMTAACRRDGKTVGVVAVDPTSPFSGGAVLGDRVRMQSHAGDPGVFIRSMATRGHLGGLARATAEAVMVLDAAGKDVVIVETVGVGQDEVDIVRTADVSIVVLVPGAGDEVQALKAGIMEIADVFVVNKADREGASRTVAHVESLLNLQDWSSGRWRPPVIETQARRGDGVDELLDALDRFRKHGAQSAPARRRARSAWRLREMLADRFLDHVSREVVSPTEMDEIIERVALREIDPYAAVSDILSRALGGSRRQLFSKRRRVRTS